MRIDRVLYCEVTLPAFHPRAGQFCPVFGYVAHHPEGPVLVDTGVGAGVAEIDRMFRVEHRSPTVALGDVGIDIAEVVMIINSHLHFDHCGNNRLFPGVPLVAQATELKHARRPRYTIPEWVDFPGARWEVVDGVAEVLPGVTVVPTPGHTLGHQSVVLEDREGCVVIAAQAVYDPVELDAERSAEGLAAAETEATAESARRIKALRPGRVLFSHTDQERPRRA